MARKKNSSAPDIAPAAPKTRDIKLAERQLMLLLDADRTLALAQERLNLVFAGIAAAAGIEADARIVALDGRTLTVEIAPE